jgi:ATP-dependent protease ClpP protease subunit
MVDFRGFEIKAKGREAEVWIYEEIGEGWFGGLGAKRFADELKALGKLDQITVRLNSPGGDVFDGIAIYNVLKANPARVVVNIDGLAASIASIIAMAGDEINMAGNATMMIHRAWGITVGNSQDMVEMGETLAKLDGTLAGTYAKRTGMDWGEVSQMMAAETWMNSQEALDKGFVDSITEEMKLAAHFDLDKFKFRHNPFAVEAQGEDKPEADAKPDSKGEPMLPDLSCFDRGIDRCQAILNKE